MAVSQLLENIPIPKMIPVRQQFSTTKVQDIAATLRVELKKPLIINQIKKDMRVAIAVGSRGIAGLPVIVKTVVEEVKRCGASPFIVPAMGSHGGATATGQKEVLESLGITEATIGCSIISDTEVVQIGALDNGLLVYMDKNAFAADGIVVINRVKPHTGFSGDHESGLLKMITVGLGKQKGASALHSAGRKYMSSNIAAAARMALQNTRILFGVATIENAYDQVMQITAAPALQIVDVDKALLVTAKKNMAKILLQPLDILIVDQIGKEFSGAGMDSHVTGRASSPYVSVGPEPNRIVILDISEKSHGNAAGMGMADVCTRNFYEKINFDMCYMNALTAGVTEGVRVPMILSSDRLAIQAAMMTCSTVDPYQMRIVRIPNTLRIRDIYISECMKEDALKNQSILLLGDAEELCFDNSGNLQGIGHYDDH
ncbi:MAG: lactate racemase domain-containing protein [Sporomusa sp.]